MRRDTSNVRYNAMKKIKVCEGMRKNENCLKRMYERVKRKRI